MIDGTPANLEVAGAAAHHWALAGTAGQPTAVVERPRGAAWVADKAAMHIDTSN